MDEKSYNISEGYLYMFSKMLSSIYSSKTVSLVLALVLIHPFDISKLKTVQQDAVVK